MKHTNLNDERRWQAVLDRDPQADGQFVFAVLTTGIFCRSLLPGAPRPAPERPLLC